MQFCCTTRAGNPYAVRAGGSATASGSTGQRRILTWNFGKFHKAFFAVEYQSDSSDADVFDRAFQENNLRDIAGAESLLDSDQAIECLVEPKHPWAEDPCTIGALAAMLLALLSSVVAKDDPHMKVELGRIGAVSALVRFLRSTEEDRVQAAVVALNYLTEDCPQNSHEAYREGAMQPLVSLLGSPVGGMRGAAASTVKNICVESEEYCDTFIRLGGMQGFVDQLDLVFDPFLDYGDLILEAVWNLEEVTTDQSGIPIERFAKLANNEGALEKLERLRSVSDSEVSTAAERALTILAQVK